MIGKPLAHIFNMSLYSGKIPSEWKQAKVVPIHEKGSINNLDNYRTISVLPVVSKIVGRIVHDQLMEFLESNKLKMIPSVNSEKNDLPSCITVLGQTRIKDKLTKETQHVDNWLKENDLIMNLDKGRTESMLLGSSRKILNKSLKIYINDSLINFTTKFKYLGVVVDQTLSLGEHFSLALKKASGRIRLSKKIRATLTLDAAESIYKCMSGRAT